MVRARNKACPKYVIRGSRTRELLAGGPYFILFDNKAGQVITHFFFNIPQSKDNNGRICNFSQNVVSCATLAKRYA